ncbi:hypothetical protein Arub01_25660 [Actinomadura rubrobrunea]|uniref:Uncharacterized protein n=1 Tax=Actinomadura rubrobrunea TaxID=115335 RepID=A0A9W6UWJ4_9ACTN|nr:hypothetical protein Arub01_25660 [Actinomadura rubrobrunea]
MNAHRTGRRPGDLGVDGKAAGRPDRCGGRASRDGNPPIGRPLTDRRETRHPYETTRLLYAMISLPWAADP